VVNGQDDGLKKDSTGKVAASTGASAGRQYAPPAGTAHARLGVSRTPQSTGEAMATTMFGPSASTGGFGFRAFRSDSPTIAHGSESPTDDNFSFAGVHDHPTFRQNSQWFFYFQLILMLVGMITVCSVSYSVYSGLVSTVCTVSTSFATVISMLTPISKHLTPPSIDRPDISLNSTVLALNAMDGTVASKDVYFLDSGCSYTILSNASVITDLHDIEPHHIEGLAGSRIIKQGGTMRLPVTDFQGDEFVMVIENVLYDPKATVNLISAKQLNRAGYGVMLMPDESSTCILTPKQSWIQQSQPRFLPLLQRNNVFLLTAVDAFTSPPADTTSSAYNATRFRHMLLEEALHLRFHVPIDKLLHMNGKVKGLPRPVRKTRATTVRCPCCDEANAKRQNSKPASETTYSRERDLWQWDMFDLGENYKTLEGNRYGTIFVARSSRYALLFLHKDKKGATIADMINRARSKFGYWPAIVRSDNAPEYDAPEVTAILDEHNIDREWSAPHLQEQNAGVETLVHMIGKGVRVLLLQSGLPVEFWGLAALHTVTVYNTLPHVSLNWLD
jgi:transposase InsO family protein